jgi:outer membrane protein assembly factor BamB
MKTHDLSRREFFQRAVGIFASKPVSTSFLKSLTESRPSTRWEFDSDGELVVLPGLVRETSLVGETLFVDSGKTAYALDRTSGERRWKFDVSTENWSLTVGPNEVYVTTNSVVHSFNADEGSKRWEFESEENELYSATTSGRVVYVSGRKGLHALSVEDGTERWKFGKNFGTPTVVGGTVYGNRSETLYALDATDGTEYWQFETDEDDHAHLADVVVGTCYLWNHGTLYAVDASAGTERWRFETDDDSYGFRGKLTEDTAYVWSEDEKTLYAVSARTGTARWQFEVSSRPRSTPNVVGDTVIVETEAAVYALDATDGTTRWRYAREIASDWYVGAVGEDAVYSHDGGALRALDLADGSERWRFAPDDEGVVYARRIDDTVYAGTNAGALYALEGPARTSLESVVHAAETNAGPLALATLLGGGLLAEVYRRTKGASGRTDDESTEEGLELLEPIETDGAMETRRARLADGREVVVKRLSEDTTPHPERFRRAVEERAELNHDSIEPVLDRGVEPTPWVALPDVTGESITDIDEATLEECVEALATACEAVHAAHRSGVTHGRLSPEDVRVASGDSDPFSVRVGGWLENAVAERDETSVYAAPEQVEDLETDPVRSDVYSLGAIAYHALGDQLPEDERRKTPSELDADVPSELDEVLSTATAPDPEERYRSALKLADMLRWAVRQ